ncbi:hypothetical protein ACS0TY_015628 [Phlomoides rotata]
MELRLYIGFMKLFKTKCIDIRLFLVHEIKNITHIQAFCGGLGFLWKVDCQVMLKSFSFNHIDVEIGEVDVWRLTGIYGFPEDGNK